MSEQSAMITAAVFDSDKCSELWMCWSCCSD